MSSSLSRFLIAAAAIVALGVALLFSAPSAQAQAPAPTAAPAAEADLLASLDADGRFTTLAAALRQTGLDSTLAAAGAVTVFAPTDDAFVALGNGALEALSTEALTAILLDHVVLGTVTAADASGVSEVTSAGGNSLAVTSADGVVTVGGATVTEADTAIGDATVHVVDAVLSSTPSDDAPDDGAM